MNDQYKILLSKGKFTIVNYIFEYHTKYIV